MMLSYSPIARRVEGVRDPENWRRRTPWGLLIHTTGGGITDVAAKLKQHPIDVAIRIYIDSQNGSNGYPWGGPAYVCDHDGTLHQIAPDETFTQHAGGTHREAYLDGTWVNEVSIATVTAWRTKWAEYEGPYHLFPSKSPNIDFIGLEMIPCGDGFGVPMQPGLRFTKAQHDACIALAGDLGARHNWPAGWGASSRLLGHEDVDPINRHNEGGGWDPGFLRASPYFDFRYVRSAL